MDKQNYEFVFIVHSPTLQNQLFLVRFLITIVLRHPGNVLILSPSGEKLYFLRFIVRLYRGIVSTKIVMPRKLSIQSALSSTSSISILHKG